MNSYSDVDMNDKVDEFLDRRAIDEAIHDTIGGAYTVLSG